MLQRLRNAKTTTAYALRQHPSFWQLLRNTQALLTASVRRIGFLRTLYALTKSLLLQIFLTPVRIFLRSLSTPAHAAALCEVLRLREAGGGQPATLVRLILASALDAESVRAFAGHAPRIACYHAASGRFEAPLTANDVYTKMRAGVFACCISYKHTRTCYAELERDRHRVYTVVARLADALQVPQLLFWSDVTGRTVGNWAECGVEPYLLVPTVRVLSSWQRTAISDSFWMSVEKVASFVRGGLITVDEDTGYFDVSSGNVFMSTYFDSLDKARMGLAKEICSPALYYRRSMFEEDKVRLLAYALQMINPNYKGRFDENGLLKVMGREQTSEFFRDLSKHWTLPIGVRPSEKRTNNGNCWRGLEELLPVVQVLEETSRAVMNDVGREMSEVTTIGKAEGSNTIVLIRLLSGMVSSIALELEVSGYMEQAGNVVGHVISYRAADIQVERSVELSAWVQKRIGFGKSNACCRQHRE